MTRVHPLVAFFIAQVQAIDRLLDEEDRVDHGRGPRTYRDRQAGDPETVHVNQDNREPDGRC